MSEPSTINMEPEQTFAALTAKAAVAGDQFMVRVFRKKGAIGAGETLATFVNGTIEQVATPEPWIARLAGGGEYTLQIAHMSKTQERVGGLLKLKVPGESRPVNPFAPQGPDWEGPQVMTYPTPTTAPVAQTGFAPVGQQNPLGPPPRQQQWGWNDQGQPMAGPGFTMQAPGVPADSLFMREQAAAEKHAVRERELSNREAQLQKQMIEREETVKRAELEQRMRADNERVAAAAEARNRALDEKLTRLTEAAARPAPAGPNVGEIVASVVAALAPIVAPLIANAGEARREAQRLAHEAALQARADAAANQAVLLKLLDKPTGLPPEVTMLFEMQKNQNQGNADMMTRMVDAMGAVSKTSVAMIEAVADMGGGAEPESPALMMMREGTKAIGALISAGRDNNKKQIAVAQQQQRAVQPQPQQQAQPAQGLPNGQSQHPNGTGAQPGSTATPHAPAGAVATGPQQAQSQQPAGPQEPAPVNGLQEAPRDSVQEMERLIRNRYEPIERVADFFVAALKTDEMKLALAEVDGDINELMADRLGDWIEQSDQNAEYITRLAEAVDVAGTAAGVFRKEDQDQPAAGAP